MYRICQARSGSFFVQKQKFSGWLKVGGFFETRQGARKFIDYLKGEDCCQQAFSPRVMEYR